MFAFMGILLSESAWLCGFAMQLVWSGVSMSNSEVEMPAGSLSHRQPRQQRSQEMVQRIIDAALALISQSGIEALTTNHIAEAAGVSVASIYQFFPNKLAIVQAVHSQWLADIDKRVDAAIHKTAACEDWRMVARAVSAELSRFTLTPEAEIELIRAMWSHRELLDLDRARNRQLSAKIANALKRFSSELDDSRLEISIGLAMEVFTLVAYKNVGLETAALDDLNDLAEHLFICALSRMFD